MWRCFRFRRYKLGGNFPGGQLQVDVCYDGRGNVRRIRLTGVTGRGDVKEVEICCIPARRERVHGVWSEYPLIHTNTLPEHYTLPIPCCGAPYQYLISPDQDFSASHQYLVTQYQSIWNLMTPLSPRLTKLKMMVRILEKKLCNSWKLPYFTAYRTHLRTRRTHILEGLFQEKNFLIRNALITILWKVKVKTRQNTRVSKGLTNSFKSFIPLCNLTYSNLT